MWYRFSVKKKIKLGLKKSPNKNIEQMLHEENAEKVTPSIFDGNDTAPTTYIDKNSSEYKEAYPSTRIDLNKGFYQNSI